MTTATRPASGPEHAHDDTALATTNARRRRLELAAFLRRRRAALQPEDVGLPPVGRRHVKGLRREEVARVAGIGASWYTLLEQGRVERVSPKTLKAIADALRLTPLEREHVFTLARDPVDIPSPPRTPDAPLLAFVRDYERGLAFMTGARADLVAWNGGADEVFRFSALPADGRNMLAAMVREPRMRDVFADWNGTLRSMIGVFRSNYASAGGVDFDLLVEALRAESPVFDAAWSAHTLDVPTAHVCELRDERGRNVRVDFLSLVPVDHPTLTVFVLTPVENGDGRIR